MERKIITKKELVRAKVVKPVAGYLYFVTKEGDVCRMKTVRPIKVAQ